MRRALLLILLIALLGVSTSLGVAWFIGGVQPAWFTSAERSWGQVGGSILITAPGRGLRIGERFGQSSPNVTISAGSVYQPPSRNSARWTSEWDIGWPFLAWRAAWRDHPSGYGRIASGDRERRS